MQDINPITRLDYPDADVIRVEDTYYMISTTMYFMPGGEILRSYDLVNWEHAAYVYDILDSTPGQTLQGDANAYGKGMWAASLRYHNHTFYVCFVANDTGKTYLYTSKSIEGPWNKRNIEGFYHDCSLLFDDDDRVYIVYGNKQVYLTELKKDLSGPLEGGLHRMIVSDEDNPSLGYEGSHLYKINGRYYVFFIHSLKDRWRRVEACFSADSLEAEFIGGDCFNDDLGYCGQGIAQGGIVDTPDGKWYAVLFQDRGAVGRIPVLIPVTWKEGYPVFGENGLLPKQFSVNSTKPAYAYHPLVESDDFKECSEDKRLFGTFGLKSCWQYNHEPDMSLIRMDREKGEYIVQTGKIASHLPQARNTLTQRMLFPGCSAEITVDADDLKEGDFAGLCVLQSMYGFAAITKRDGQYRLVMHSGDSEMETIAIDNSKVRFKVLADFMNMKDEAEFFYEDHGEWKRIGTIHKMSFKLEHFTGNRFGLFIYSTKEIGGCVAFSDFVYNK